MCRSVVANLQTSITWKGLVPPMRSDGLASRCFRLPHCCCTTLLHLVECTGLPSPPHLYPSGQALWFWDVLEVRTTYFIVPDSDCRVIYAELVRCSWVTVAVSLLDVWLSSRSWAPLRIRTSKFVCTRSWSEYFFGGCIKICTQTHLILFLIHTVGRTRLTHLTVFILTPYFCVAM
jgi:hypothetical protein